MTLRYDIIEKIANWHDENDVEDPSERSVSIAVAEDPIIREMYMEKYGNTLPHALDNRKKSLLFRDVRRKMSGQPVQGGEQGTGHRNYTGSSEVELSFV